MLLRSRTCKNCRFFQEMHSQSECGTCKRYPPQPVTISESGFDHTISRIGSTFAQPEVTVLDWCGEWGAIPDVDDRISVPKIAGGKCEQ